MLCSENYDYYYQILELEGVSKPERLDQDLTDTEEEKAKTVLEGYEKNMPKSLAPKRLQLDLLKGENFRQKLKEYSTPLIIKGVPPFLHDLRLLYQHQGKT